MRPLKFRVWERERSRFLYPKEGSAYTIDSTTGKPAYGHAIGGSDGISVGLTLNGLPYFRCHNVMGELENSVVQQFTGLLDRNGKEIYEGDIVKSGYENKYGKFYYNYIVSYNQKTCVFEGLMNLEQKAVGIRMTHNNKSIEVIGNIFKNPELIK